MVDLDKRFRWAEKGGKLIFLISLPRSGSTLLQRIMAGHPDIATLPEPWIMLHASYLLKKMGIAAEYNADLAKEAMDGFLLNIGATDDLLVESIRSQAGVLYKKALQVEKKRFFLDKTPRYYNIITELHRIFPDARFVFLLRNPIAVFASVLVTWYAGDRDKFLKSENYRQDLLRGPANLANGIDRLGEKAVIIHYENFVAESKGNLRRLFKNLGVSYIAGLDEYANHPFKESRFGDQVGVVKHKKPMAYNAEKWRSTLEKTASKQLAIEYLEYLGPELLCKLGYSYDELNLALKENETE